MKSPGFLVIHPTVTHLSTTKPREPAKTEALRNARACRARRASRPGRKRCAAIEPPFPCLQEVSIKGFVIAGTRSGSGKTTIALGFMAAFRRRGLAVAPFKVGPDFIDPGHHTRIAAAVSRNLDGWMLPRETNLAIFARSAAGADVAVVEGVMGLFDGYDGRSEEGSTAQMAKWTGAPVLLVVDAKSMARSAAALVYGFETFDPALRFAGVIFNHVGSPRHLEYLREIGRAHV